MKRDSFFCIQTDVLGSAARLLSIVVPITVVTVSSRSLCRSAPSSLRCSFSRSMSELASAAGSRVASVDSRDGMADMHGAIGAGVLESVAIGFGGAASDAIIVGTGTAAVAGTAGGRTVSTAPEAAGPPATNRTDS